MTNPVSPEAFREQAAKLRLFTTPEAAARLGITPDQFRRLAKRLGLEPAGWFENPHYRSGPECPLWGPEPIEALAGGPQVAAVQQRAQSLKDAKERAQRLRGADGG